MNRNMRSALIYIAADCLRGFGGHNLTREQATALLPLWPHVESLSDDMRVEVLGHFRLDEPLMVPGVDFAPCCGGHLIGKPHTPECPHAVVSADAATFTAETLTEPHEHGYTPHGHPCCRRARLSDRPSGRHRCGGVRMCAACKASAAEIHGSPLVEVQPDAEVLCPDCQHPASKHNVTYGCDNTDCLCLNDPPSGVRP